jgi:hypothetical protein
MRSTFLLTTPRGALNAVRHRGILITDNYQQFQKILNDKLSERHARFLAEPVHSRQGDTIDWYAKVQGTPILLTDLPDEEQAEARRGVALLAKDIESLAQAMQLSGNAGAVLRGGILEKILTYSGDGRIFMLGDQPVLTCWGFEPERSGAVPQTLVRFGEFIPPPPPEAVTETPEPEPVPEHPADIKPVRPPFPFFKAFLGIIAGALFVYGLFALSLLIPGPSGKFVESLLFPTGSSLPDDVRQHFSHAEEELSTACRAAQEMETSLTRDLGEIRERMGETLAQCVHIPAYKTGDPLSIPLEAYEKKNIRFLKGCWSSGSSRLDPGKGVINSAGKRLAITYCFTPKGTGEQTIREAGGSSECKGSLDARFDEAGLLIIEESEVTCPGSGAGYMKGRVECVRDGQSQAHCYGVNPRLRAHKWGADLVRK